MSADTLRGHKLITKALMAKIPELYSTENDENELMAWVKLFSPYNGWYWYILEFDGVDTCFGYVMGDFNEYGYFSLAELTETMFKGIVPAIERDLGFDPKPLSEVIKDHEKWNY